MFCKKETSMQWANEQVFLFIYLFIYSKKGNSIGKKGAQVLSEVLKTNTSLLSINLAGLSTKPSDHVILHGSLWNDNGVLYCCVNNMQWIEHSKKLVMKE